MGRRRRGPKTKRDAQIKHAIKRAQQRLDLWLTPDEIERMVSAIQATESECIDKQSHRTAVHRLQWGDRSVYAVYDKVRKVVVTFLTEDMINANFR